MIRKTDENENMELKKKNDPYLGERKENIKITYFEVEELFREILNKYSTSPEETTEPNYFLTKMMSKKQVFE